MDLIIEVLFYFSAFIILWAMLGYELSLKFFNKLYKKRNEIKDYNYQPTVTLMVVAHNEEKVILSKLENLLTLNYSKGKLNFLITSDNSTDKTNDIARKFIKEHQEIDIILYEVKKRQGKTNAQNEAHKLVDTEFLVMTDANSMLEENAIKELMASFSSKDIGYVTGKLSIVNSYDDVGKAESSYWNKDLAMREIESKIQTITAGNGALYACRTSEYYDFNPIKSHDSAMPLHFALKGKRAICNHDAIAYEKSGSTIEDEFSRKVRMNRRILDKVIPDVKMLNIFKYRWFTYFYFGHRTCRYLLWLSHGILLITNTVLAINSSFYFVLIIGQVLFYLLAILQMKLKSKSKVLRMANYYTVTIFAQWVGVYNILTGKAKPFWEKAESTR